MFHFVYADEDGNGYINEDYFGLGLLGANFVEPGEEEVIPLPENDYLLGIAQVFETLADLREDHAHIDYYRLSEIRLAYYPNEQEDFRNDED